MDTDAILTALRDRDVMIPLLCSLVAGALIGTERELNRKPAGIRTHTLLCFAAALMTLLGLRMNEWVVYLPEGTQVVSDMSRMPHAILTGVGFLGAGVIFREGANVQGLTTAASLWLTAALGVVFGTGLLALGLIGAAIAIAVLVLLRIFQRLAPPPPFARLEIEVGRDSDLTAEVMTDRLRAGGMECGPVGFSLDTATGQRRYEVMISSRNPVSSPEDIALALKAAELSRLSVSPVLPEGG